MATTGASFVVANVSAKSPHVSVEEEDSSSPSVLKPIGDDWIADPASDSVSDEDYDAIKLDPETVVNGSTGAGAESEPSLMPPATTMIDAIRNHSSSSEDTHFAPIRRPSTPSKTHPPEQRKSIKVKLETTNKKGRYILTADDPELRAILRSSIERETSEGKSGKHRTRFRDLVFTRQFTTFDRQNPLSAESPFHGFFTLFWLAIGLLLVRIAGQNWRTYGNIFGNAELLHIMFDRDLIVLGITDGVMTVAMAFGWALQKIIVKGYLNWNTSGWIIQNLWQTFYLGACIGWTYYRNWPWTHTVFIVLHSLVFVMKQHSYAFYNGYCKLLRYCILYPAPNFSQYLRCTGEERYWSKSCGNSKRWRLYQVQSVLDAIPPPLRQETGLPKAMAFDGVGPLVQRPLRT